MWFYFLALDGQQVLQQLATLCLFQLLILTVNFMVSWNKINSYQLLRYLFTITVQFIPNTFLPGQFISKQFIPRQFIPWDSSYPEQFIPGTVHTWDSSYPGTVHTLRQFIPRKFIPGDEFSGYELSWVWIVLDMNCLRVWIVSGYELSQGMNCLKIWTVYQNQIKNCSSNIALKK